MFWSVSLSSRTLLGSHATAFYCHYDSSAWHLLSSDHALTAQPLCRHIPPRSHSIAPISRALRQMDDNSCLGISFYPACGWSQPHCHYPISVARPNGLSAQLISPLRLPTTSILCPEGEGEYRLAVEDTTGGSDGGCTAEDRRRTVCFVCIRNN